MKNMHSFSRKFALALLLVPVIFLPSCAPWNWLKEKMGCNSGGSVSVSDNSPVLVSLKGSPVITQQSFEKEFEQLIEENPHLKSVLALMPDAKKNFLQGMVNQEVVDRWVTENQVDQKNEYRKELDRMMRSVRRMLNTKYFGLEHPVNTTETEVAEFYEKNKDSMPDLMISRGGVQATGVSFDKELDAKIFLAKARELKDVKKAADAAKLTKNYRDFKVVNSQSLGMDAALRDKIAAAAKVPSMEVVKISDNSFWVVSTTSKEETKYRPYDQVKSGLEQFVAKEKRMEMFDKEIAKLKTDYTLVVNDEALKPAQQPDQALAQAAGQAQQVATAQAAQPENVPVQADAQAAQPAPAQAEPTAKAA